MSKKKPKNPVKESTVHDMRVIRGGSWSGWKGEPPEDARVAYRGDEDRDDYTQAIPEYRDGDHGFRIARTKK